MKPNGRPLAPYSLEAVLLVHENGDSVMKLAHTLNWSRNSIYYRLAHDPIFRELFTRGVGGPEVKTDGEELFKKMVSVIERPLGSFAPEQLEALAQVFRIMNSLVESFELDDLNYPDAAIAAEYK